MRKSLALAVTVDTYQSPFRALAESAFNLSTLIIDFMYGTPERCRFTFMFAVGLGILGLGIGAMHDSPMMQGCPVSTL